MPRIPLDQAHKATSAFDYPRLKLDKGEHARVLCIEKEPLFEYVHTLRAPQILNERPVMEMTTAKDGTKVEQVKFDFIGRHICIGDYGVIAEKGVDVKGCPVCKASTESDAVRPPERRFAFHIIRYSTQPGGFTLASPFQVQLLAWAFGDTIYNKLVDIASEWGPLQDHDLNLGPCTVAQFQKFEIAVASKAAWKENEQTQQLVLQTFKDNQCPDLTSLIGRKLSRPEIEQDLERVITRYKIAYASGAAVGEQPTAEELANTMGTLDLESLLSGDIDSATGGGPVTPAEPPVDTDVVPPTTATPTQVPTPAPAPPAQEELNLEDLLANI